MKFSPEQILNYMQRKYHKVCPLGVYLLEYFDAQGLLKISQCGGRIVGAIIFRKVKLSRFDPRDHTSHNPRGDCAFVSELCADDKKAVADLEYQMRQKLGKCKHIGMHRHGKLKFYDYGKYINNLLGKERL